MKRISVEMPKVNHKIKVNESVMIKHKCGNYIAKRHHYCPFCYELIEE